MKGTGHMRSGGVKLERGGAVRYMVYKEMLMAIYQGDFITKIVVFTSNICAKYFIKMKFSWP
jgi:uncharacterized transporter YbjL